MLIVHLEKLRWLFWLRWKLFLRGFTRDKGRLVGLIFLILFGLPFIGGIAVGSYFFYRYLPAPLNATFLYLVLTGVYLLWIALPLLEYTVNEGLDISKLAPYPLTRPELMLSLIFSTLLDVPTIGLLLVFAAVVAGWGSSVPLVLLALLTMIIFYVQVIGMSQLVLALLMRTLQSRRYRDLSIVLLAILSSSFYIIMQLIFRGLDIGSPQFAEHIRQLTIAQYLQWLPSGMAARAIEQAAAGNWGASALWLAALLVVSVVVLYLWQLVVERGLTAAESGGSVAHTRQQRARTSVVTETGARSTSSGNQALTQVLAIAGKDLKYLRRDPQLLSTLFQSLMSIAVLLFVFVFRTGDSSQFTSWSVLLAPAFIFLSLYSFYGNTLGIERQSLTTLFLFPVAPQRILWGKNLVTLILALVEMIALIILTASISQGWNEALPALVIGLAAIGVMLGCGNFSSIFLPQRMRQAMRGFRTTANYSSESGCLRAILSMAALLVTAILLIPVGLALLVPLILHARWAWAFTIPLSLLYGVAFYFIVTALVARRMLDREPEILQVVTRE